MGDTCRKHLRDQPLRACFLAVAADEGADGVRKMLQVQLSAYAEFVHGAHGVYGIPERLPAHDGAFKPVRSVGRAQITDKLER